MRAQLPQLAEGIPVAVVTGTNGLDLTWWKWDMLEWWSKLDIPWAGFLTISSIDLYSDFPNLSHFPLFLPYSLHFPPKNSWWEAFGFDRFSNFCQFLGELDGSGSCPLWFLWSAGHLQYPIYPLNNFLKTVFCFRLQVLMRSWCNLNWREILTWLAGSTHKTWCLNLFAF